MKHLAILIPFFLTGVLRAEIANPQPKSTPPLTQLIKIEQDELGKRLQSSFIWTDLPKERKGVAVGFRKSFDLKSKPKDAVLHLFADARYILWVNGNYVDRGPARFQPNGPEYDSIDIAKFLHPGKNALALLVVGNLSGGKVMRHEPGLTVSLDIDGKTALLTDDSWRWSDGTRFRAAGASWANLGETEVDARIEDGDWTQADYHDEKWKNAVPITSKSWGPLTALRIPMLREKPVPFHLATGVSLPVTLKQGEKLEFTTDRLVQAYPIIEFKATAGTEITIEPFGFHYIAREGKQTHFTIDTRGFAKGAIIIQSGQATITDLKIVERLYPYERLGSFHSNDEFLNKLWEMSARSCEILSEDSYVDCADRERVEWMDDTPPGYDITRTTMAGVGSDGKLQYGDPRLLKELIRRTALTLQPEGWVKAHTCSDRYDIHAKMEDRACDWLEGVRLYYEATGDKAALKEIWPAIAAQMDFFLQRRTERGLVRARDWVVWGNPVSYQTGEGTTLNAFVYRALEDAAKVGDVIGEKVEAERFAKGASDLKKSINNVLWNEEMGTYSAGFFTDADLEESKRKFGLARTNNIAIPTLHSSVFALDRGVVPSDRHDRVVQTMVAQDQKGEARLMTYYYLAKQLYAMDQPSSDQRVLDLLRKKWIGMVDSPWQCSWEEFGGSSKAHIYGMYPGYFLSAYVLGVRRDAPVADKVIRIEPHLGDLKNAEGTVVTEFGPVRVAWKNGQEKLCFEITLPGGIKSTLALPYKEGRQTIELDGKKVEGVKNGNRIEINLPAGTHSGAY